MQNPVVLRGVARKYAVIAEARRILSVQNSWGFDFFVRLSKLARAENQGLSGEAFSGVAAGKCSKLGVSLRDGAESSCVVCSRGRGADLTPGEVPATCVLIEMSKNDRRGQGPANLRIVAKEVAKICKESWCF